MTMKGSKIASLLRRRDKTSEEPAKAQIVAFVVDDEQVIASTVATILTVYGFNATAYTSAEDALAAAESAAPDILITDVAMPGMNGIDLAIRFEKLYSKCKLLLFSGQVNNSHALEVARSQGHNFKLLTKPVHPKDLLDAINKLTPDA
jgi:FixJ family two-component response regulator